MYVLCVGMYRACSTWQYEVVAHLLEKHRGGRRVGYLTGEKFGEMVANGDDDGSWIVIKSHEEHHRFADLLTDGRAIAVYAHRDVRDVAFSLMHKRQVDFGTLVTRGMVHQVLANDRFWAAQPGSITQRYEHLVEDPTTGVKQLASHLGLTLAPGEAASVAAEYSFRANRQRTIDLGKRLERDGVDLDDPSVAQAHDRRTLLHWNHMREGRVGDWADRATAAQRAILARICGRWLVDHGYEADDRLAKPAAPSIRSELTMARGWLACRLRCLSLRHPRLARAIKPMLGIAPEAPLAQPAPLPAHAGQGAMPNPHRAGVASMRVAPADR